MLDRSILVRANLTSCEGQRYCGAGWSAMLCVAPPYTGPLVAGAADVTIEVTVNGQPKRLKPQEISAMVLSKMRETAEAYLGKEVINMVVTVREALLCACAPT